MIRWNGSRERVTPRIRIHKDFERWTWMWSDYKQTIETTLIHSFDDGEDNDGEGREVGGSVVVIGIQR